MFSEQNDKYPRFFETHGLFLCAQRSELNVLHQNSDFANFNSSCWNKRSMWCPVGSFLKFRLLAIHEIILIRISEGVRFLNFYSEEENNNWPLSFPLAEKVHIAFVKTFRSNENAFLSESYNRLWVKLGSDSSEILQVDPMAAFKSFQDWHHDVT